MLWFRLRRCRFTRRYAYGHNSLLVSDFWFLGISYQTNSSIKYDPFPRNSL